jgi:uncharacterized protein GlcG (DUF336 family)
MSMTITWRARVGRTACSCGAVGQAEAVARATDLFARPEYGMEGTFPQLYFFDCHSCHRAITDGAQRQLTFEPNPGRPITFGQPPFNDENIIMLDAVARVLAPARADTFRSASRAFHAAMNQGRAEAQQAAIALRGEAASLSDTLAARAGSGDAFHVIAAIGGEASAPRFTDYAGSVQAVMAIDTLLNALVRDGPGDAGRGRRHPGRAQSRLCRRRQPAGLSPGRIPRRAGQCRQGHRTAGMMRARGATALLASAALLLAGCGGSSTPAGNGGGATGGTPAPTPTPTPPGALFVPPALESLTAADVQTIIAQAVGEAEARSLPSIIAVTDRVGNVLAVFSMTGAPAIAKVSERQLGGMAQAGTTIGLQGAEVPATAAAIAKALTGAYLSSGGNAFSTRTASQIVQEHFPPAPSTVGLESGPLFGVQFSQLPCSDLNTRFLAGGGAQALIGPKRSPLGLAADPGGFPLYKNGVVVGGIGVMGDGDYGFDPNILDVEDDAEEAIALAGTQGFLPPAGIRAERIFVDGTALRFFRPRSGIAQRQRRALCQPAWPAGAGPGLYRWQPACRRRLWQRGLGRARRAGGRVCHHRGIRADRRAGQSALPPFAAAPTGPMSPSR